MKTTVKAHKRKFKSGKVIKVRRYSKINDSFISLKEHKKMFVNVDNESNKMIETGYYRVKKIYNGPFPLRIFRSISVYKISDIRINNLGIFWTNKWNKAFTMSSDLESEAPFQTIFDVKVKKDDIDWKKTLNVNSIYSSEFEITLKDKIKLRNVKVYKEFSRGQRVLEKIIPTARSSKINK